MSKEDCQRVRVGVRVRPLGNIENAQGAGSVFNLLNNKSIRCNLPSVRQNVFNFDWAFGPSDSQSSVYRELGNPLLDGVFQGINATILACKCLDTVTLVCILYFSYPYPITLLFT